MPSRNVLRNWNLATSIDTELGGFPGPDVWFWGDMSSYDSGSNIWYDKTINGNDATVFGADLQKTGSLGFLFNGTDNYLKWDNGAFSASSCVDSSYTIQVTLQPNTSVTLNPWKTVALFDNKDTIVGGTGLMDIYLNDGLNPTPGGTPTQGMNFSVPGPNRNTYLYGADATGVGFFTTPQTITWTFFPTSGIEQPYSFNYFISGFGISKYTEGGNVQLTSDRTPTKTFGLPVYTSTGTSGGSFADLTYNYYDGIVRDIVIYKRKLTDYEIFRNTYVLNVLNNQYNS